MSTISALSSSSTIFDLFRKTDSDGSGSVSQSELQSLSEKVASSSLDLSDEAFAGYDSDGDGTLSEDELNAVLDSGKPPMGMEGMAPPPPSNGEAVSAYADNTGDEDDTLASIIAGLQSLMAQLQSGSSDPSSSQDGQDGFFSTVDGDASGGISLDELTTLAQNLGSVTGQSITVDEESFASYDSDGDGVLGSDELKTFMEQNGLAAPPPPGGMAMAPPPPEREGETLKSDATDSSGTSGAELIAQLQTLLDKLSRSYGSQTGSGTESLLSVSG